MRPQFLILLIFCFISCPVLLGLFSLLFTSSNRVDAPNSPAGRTNGLRAFFSFNIPSSLFPPSAIVSLTDDNSTFFLARPAAFGPLLPADGLSGQLWVGNGFGDGGTSGAEGELGCSDIPGWGESSAHHRQERMATAMANAPREPIAGVAGDSSAARRTNTRQSPYTENDNTPPPSAKDGTDDHLHHPLPESDSSNHRGQDQNKPSAHADIQSLQESAEIAGKVVLLRRGGCGFLEKVKWAQRRGGVALIVGDDSKGGTLVTMYARGDTSNVSIPAIFTSYTTAHLLSSLVPPEGSGAGYRPSLTRSAAATSVGPSKQGSRSDSTAASSTVPTPTQTSNFVDTSKLKAGKFHSFLALLGLSDGGGEQPYGPPEDSRRPPSSGNINWVLMDNRGEHMARSDESTVANERDHSRGERYIIPKESRSSSFKQSRADGNDFTIGVQDWRDPDMIAPRRTGISPRSTSTGRKGDRPSWESGHSSESPSETENDRLTNTFSRSEPVESVPKRHSSLGTQGAAKSESTPRASNLPDRDRVNQNARTGLWVTLTPASMSTSPFFDTLLVLVVSPLLTLSVVYALLLLRSRIRRRRWRAPKSVVDRLPVRTYHTVTTASSSTSSLRSTSPGPSSPTDPLLGHGSRSSTTRPRPRSGQQSQTSLGRMPSSANRSKETAPSAGEKPGSGSTLWRRKYTGRQVECVVCLEEYVDGQSRVMSLPCGHEFHAECM